MASSKEFVCAGSKSEPPPHGKTEIKMEITPNELGPLSLFEGKHDSSLLSSGNIQEGTYKVHEERLQFFDGFSPMVSLSVKIEFVKTTTPTYKSGDTIVVETTHHYNMIYIWS